MNGHRSLPTAKKTPKPAKKTEKHYAEMAMQKKCRNFASGSTI
jgi:hypothetical protein